MVPSFLHFLEKLKQVEAEFNCDLPAKIKRSQPAGNGSDGVEICQRHSVSQCTLNPAKVQLPSVNKEAWPIGIGVLT